MCFGVDSLLIITLVYTNPTFYRLLPRVPESLYYVIYVVKLVKIYFLPKNYEIHRFYRILGIYTPQ